MFNRVKSPTIASVLPELSFALERSVPEKIVPTATIETGGYDLPFLETDTIDVKPFPASVTSDQVLQKELVHVWFYLMVESIFSCLISNLKRLVFVGVDNTSRNAISA